MRLSIRVFIVTFLTVIALFGVASGRANARPVDQEFFADLTALGITVENKDGLISYSKWICTGLVEHKVPVEAIKDLVVAAEPTLSDFQAKGFIVVSVRYYCPVLLDDAPVVKR